MLIGIIGAPNKGKSTLFSALTANEVAIADYPFTTIDPNKGIAYATRECAEKMLGVRCRARNSLCIGGTRMLPVNVIDVAGLVEGAHDGKGMGNQFLNDLAAADAFMLVVDASGKTDKSGNPASAGDMSDDVFMVIDELQKWMAGIIKRNLPSARRTGEFDVLQSALSSFKISKVDTEKAIEECYLPPSSSGWSDQDINVFAGALIRRAKPVIVIANKMDSKDAKENLEAARKKLEGFEIFGCSAAIEVALRKAASQGIIDYLPGGTGFQIIREVSEEQRRALEYMRGFIEANGGTGVQAAINSVVFKVLDNIVVYPVEDEGKYTDHFGNVLPDAILLRRGSTALDLAEKIHTDLAKHMLYAVDAVRKIRIGKDYVLNDGDVVKIVSSAK